MESDNEWINETAYTFPATYLLDIHNYFEGEASGQKKRKKDIMLIFIMTGFLNSFCTT